MKKEQVYILNLDAVMLVGKTNWKNDVPVKTFEKAEYNYNTYYMRKDGEKDKRVNREYKKATITSSLDLDKLKAFDKKLIRRSGKKFYTNAIINVTFKSNLNEYSYRPRKKVWERDSKKRILTKEAIREKLYEKGFTVDGIKYVEYKRSSSKGRTGSTLFIREDLYDKMIAYSRIGIEFEEDEMLDIASLRAYESLSLSSIEGTIIIEKQQILMIEDKYSKFKVKAMVTNQLDDGSVITEEQDTEVSNCLFDGQCLLSSTLFKGEYKNQGMMLLRNRWFKSCAFNTNLTQWFNNNKIKTVKDMFGVEHNASDIKLICTPSSLKFLKLDYKFNGNKQECYTYWLDNIDSEFGIVKSEHPSKLLGYNALSYQMINSLPLNKDQVHYLAEREIRYIERIRDDIEAFKTHIAFDDKSLSRMTFNKIIQKNNDIIYTDLFKKFKSATLSSYKTHVKTGKVRVKGDYCTMVNNPFLMLLHAIGKYDEDKDVLKGNQIYCSAYAEGEKLCGFRNPNVCTGNVYLAENHYDDKFKTYFNFTDNICVTNAVNNDIMNRLSGCDWDSDVLLLSNDEVLVEMAEKSQEWLTPISDIKADTKLRPYNKKSMCEVDSLIAENYIGEIVNISQTLNSYYWDVYNKNNNDEKLQDIYRDICTLSVLSGTEIDKAKKLVNIDCEVELKKIEDKYDCTKPRFFNAIKQKKRKKKIKSVMNYSCPMNYLQDFIEEIKNDRSLIRKKIDITDLLDYENTEKTVNKKQIKNIKLVVKTLDNKINAMYNIYSNEDDDNTEQVDLENEKALNQLRSLHINKATMLDMIKRVFDSKSKDKKISDYKLRLLNMLIAIDEKTFLSCFRSLNK